MVFQVLTLDSLLRNVPLMKDHHPYHTAAVINFPHTRSNSATEDISSLVQSVIANNDAMIGLETLVTADERRKERERKGTAKRERGLKK